MLKFLKSSKVASPASEPLVDKPLISGPTFCVYPWIEQVVQPTGKISFCCVAKDGGPVTSPGGQAFRAAQDRLSDAWNSQHMRDIRKRMLAGEKVAGCELCYFQESIGKNSYRQMHNEEWLKKHPAEIEARVRRSNENGHIVDQPALYLDLRLGNLCNLKCRSCNPYNSSQIHKEVSSLLDTDPAYNDFWYNKAQQVRPAPFSNWFESDLFWDEVIESIPQLKKVYLTGGEPTLIENNYRFLRECIDSGHSKHIFLMFNTNCTNIQDRFLDLLPEFEFVLVNASIDGVGKVNDYIRYLSRWDTVSRNLNRLTELPGNIQVGVTPVVQTYNVLVIADLLQHIEDLSLSAKREINVDFLYATEPTYLDVRILPKVVRTLAGLRIEEFKRRSKTYGHHSFLTNSVDSFLNLISRSDDGDPVKLEHFLTYTELLDRHRKQCFKTTFPDLAEQLTNPGTVADVHV